MARGCALFDLQDNPTSPIIMSHRVCDRSKELAVIMQVFVQTYTTRGYPVSQGILPAILEIEGANGTLSADCDVA